MDAGLLDVLHDARDDDVLAVAERVHVELVGVLEEAVDEDRAVRERRKRLPEHEAERVLVVRDAHRAPAEDVARADEEREAEPPAHADALLGVARDAPGRRLEVDFLEELAEALAVLGAVDRLGLRPEDRDARVLEGVRELERRLAAELHEDALGLLALHDGHHVLERERLEVEAVRRVVVGRDRLGVAVHHHGLVARLGDRLGGVDAAVVELEALPDPVRSRAEDDDLLLRGDEGLVFRLVAGVEVGRHRLEFGRAGVDAAEDGRDVEALSCRRDAGGGAAREDREIGVREPGALGVAEEAGVLERLLPRGLHTRLDGEGLGEAVEEPAVDPGDLRDRLDARSGAQGGEDGEDPVGPRDAQRVGLRRGHRDGVHPAGAPGLERAQRFSERLGERPPEGHDFADRLHLHAERRIGARELLEREARDFRDDVVERRLERGGRLLRDVVRNLVEAVADGEEGRDLRDREARCLRGERRRPRDARVHLDHDPAARLRVDRELDVRAARRDADGADDLLRVVAHRLVLDVRERHLGGDRDRVARVDAHRVEVLDRADDDECVRRVPHDLELELLPAEDGLLDEDLVRRGERQAALDDGLEVVLVERDPAAGPAEREGRADDDGVAERNGDGPGLVEAPRHPGLQDVDADLLHRLLEEEAVLAELHGADRGPERLDAVLCEDAGLVEGDREVQGRLPADGREEGVGLFLRDDRGDRVAVERLDVRRVRELGVRHDRGGVRVHEDDAVALAPQRAARLGPRVVELAGLPDHDRARAQHENRPDVRAFRHRSRSLREARRRRLAPVPRPG